MDKSIIPQYIHQLVDVDLTLITLEKWLAQRNAYMKVFLNNPSETEFLQAKQAVDYCNGQIKVILGLIN